jgi:hypothetical protein
MEQDTSNKLTIIFKRCIDLSHQSDGRESMGRARRG